MSIAAELYWISGSAPCWRVAAVLKAKNLPFKSKQLEGKDIKCPEVMELNPRGQMPTFRDGDVIVNESLAAMQYLDYAYPDVPLMPKDPAARGRALQRFHEVSSLFSAVQPIFYVKMVGKVKTPEDEERFNEGMEKSKKELALFDSYLKDGRNYIAADMLTLADINLAIVCCFAMRGGASLAAFPSLLKYVERMKEEKCIKETWPPHWKESPAKDWLKGL